MPLLSEGTMMLGGVAEGLSSGIDTYLKVKANKDAEDRRKQEYADAKKYRDDEYNLHLTAQGYTKDPSNGLITPNFLKTKQNELAMATTNEGLEEFAPGVAAQRAGIARGAAKQLGVDIPSNASYAAIKPNIGLLEKVGALKATAATKDAKSTFEQKKYINDLKKELQKDLDPDSSRTGNFGKISNTVIQAQKLKALAQDHLGNPANLDRRQQEELAIGAANMLSQGGQAAQSIVHNLVPSSMAGDFNKIKEWWLNNPTGLGQVEFTKRLLETIDREEGVANTQLNKIRKSRLSKHAELQKLDPAGYKEMLGGYGLDEGGGLLPTETKQPMNTSAVQAHPQDNEAVNWAKSNPNDPRAAAILKANGAQ